MKETFLTHLREGGVKGDKKRGGKLRKGIGEKKAGPGGVWIAFPFPISPYF